MHLYLNFLKGTIELIYEVQMRISIFILKFSLHFVNLLELLLGFHRDGKHAC